VSPDFLGRLAEVLYEDARCGFFHDGAGRDRILFSDNLTAEFVVTVPNVAGKPDEAGIIQSVLINPKSFYGRVETHFVAYVKALRDAANPELRANFKAAVDTKWQPGSNVIVGMTQDDFNKGVTRT
jgi:hypothetical protein